MARWETVWESREAKDDEELRHDGDGGDHRECQRDSQVD